MNISKQINKILSLNDLIPLKERANRFDDYKVTIICTTFNHEKYIRRCLDSFLFQKTNFDVQIIVHDDASTDNTQNILMEYKNKYPNIFTLILQKTNQHSKNKSIIKKAIIEQIKGKYVAKCEGDDYWSDQYKLFLQFNLMEQNPHCSFCVHKVKVVNNNDNSLYFYPKFNLKSKILTSKKFIKLVSESYSFQTSSYFRRSKDLIELIDVKPDFVSLMPNGDEANLLYFGSIGNVLYIDRIMSVYNKFTESSWTTIALNYDSNTKIEREKRICESLLSFDEFTNHKYHSSVMRRYYGLLYTISKQENNAKETFIANKKFRHYLLFNRFWLYCYCVLKYIL